MVTGYDGNITMAMSKWQQLSYWETIETEGSEKIVTHIKRGETANGEITPRYR